MGADGEVLQRGGPPGAQLAVKQQVAGPMRAKLGKGHDLVFFGPLFQLEPPLKLAEAMGVLGLPHPQGGKGAASLWGEGWSLAPNRRATPGLYFLEKTRTELLAEPFLSNGCFPLGLGLLL